MNTISPMLMTLFDVTAVGCAVYASIFAYRNRKIASELRLYRPIAAILIGLWLLAGMFAADLITTHLVSHLTSMAWALAFLAEFQLGWSWIMTFAAVTAITGGFVTAVMSLPRVRLMLRSMSRANSALDREHTARLELESQLRQSERTHAFAIRKRTMELRQANERLHKEIAVHRMTARSLRESEVRFRSLSEGSIQGIIVINNDWKVLYVNKAFVKMLGYDSIEEITDNLRFETFYAPHEFERMSRYREARMRDEDAPITYEVDVLRADGEVIAIHNTLQVVTWNGESAKQFTIIDVSDRRRAERNLKKSAQRYRDLIEDAVQGIIIHENRKPIFVNQAYANILGYDSPDEVLALSEMERIYAPSEHARLRAYQRARTEGRPAPSQYEFEAVKSDGSLAVLQNVVRMVDWDGRKVTQHNVIDVTERRRAEEALRASEQHYRELVEGSVQGILIMHDFVPLFANDAYARLLGFDSAADFLRHGTMQDRYAPHERKRITAYWKNRIDGKPAPDEYEVDMLHKNGAVVTVHNVLRNVSWEGKAAVQVAAIDITARRRAEEEKALLVRDLKERVKELTMLRQHSLKLQRAGLSPEALCSSTAEALKRSFMFTDITETRVEFGGVEARTSGWRQTEWCLEQKFAIRDGRTGCIQVCYLESRPEADEGPFLIEERSLLKSVAAMLSTYLERERAQAEADENRALLESAFSGLSEAVFVIDADSRRIVACNESAGRIFDYPADELIGVLTEQLFESKESYQNFFDLYAPVLKSEGRFQSEYPFQRRDGTRVLTGITMSLFETGKGSGIVSVVKDITGEKALRDSVARCQHIVSANRDPMYYVDDCYTFKLANAAAATWHGRAADEIVGSTVADLYGEGRFESVLKPCLDRCLAGEQVEYRSTLEYTGRESCDAAIRFEPCRDDGGRVVGAAVTERDLSAYTGPGKAEAGGDRVVVPMNAPRR